MGFFDKLKEGLGKTKSSFDEKLNSAFSAFRKVDEELLEELEEILITSDIGLDTSVNIISNLRTRIKKENIKEAEEVKQALREEMEEILNIDNTMNLQTKPSVILADEPTGNLDGKTSQNVARMLKMISLSLHQTLVIITHKLELAQLADDVIQIRDGRIINKN